MHWQRIETGWTAAGVPDVNYCAGGVEGWLELKAVAGFLVTIRPMQAAWAARRLRAGGRVACMVRRRAPANQKRPQRLDELWLVPGNMIRVGLRLDPAAMLHWPGGPARWPWHEVLAELTVDKPRKMRD